MNMRYCTLLLSILNFSIAHTAESVIADKSWQDLQIESHNAVVRVSAVSRAFNWFAPHCINGTNTFTGTGFFINEDGDIVTCSHVVENAIAVLINIPSLGKQTLRAHVVSICPQHDIALLRLDDEALAIVRAELGQINCLQLSDSDKVQRGEEVISLGYPARTIEIEQLKGTTGVISARLNRLFQCDAPTNPGNSGGPVLNRKGMVIGITTSQIVNAQNANFVTPINTFKSLVPRLYEHKLLKINDFGIIWSPTTLEIRKYLGNAPEGCVITDFSKSGKALSSGLQEEDIICAVNGYSLDDYGEIKALCDGEKMRFSEYLAQLPLDTDVSFDIYRDGELLTLIIPIENEINDSIPIKYPAYETVEYEIFSGMIIMPLTENYINQDSCIKNRPALRRYLANLYDQGPRLVIANIIPDAKIARSHTMNWGDTINEVNGEKVSTLEDFRTALKKSIETGIIVMKTTDECDLKTDNILNVLSLNDACKETVELSHIHGYRLSETVTELIEHVDASLLSA